MFPEHFFNPVVRYDSLLFFPFDASALENEIKQKSERSVTLLYCLSSTNKHNLHVLTLGCLGSLGSSALSALSLSAGD